MRSTVFGGIGGLGAARAGTGSARRLARLTRVLLVLLAATMVPVWPSPVGAQDDDGGLVDDTTYRSPQFGYEITWEEPWDAGPTALSLGDAGDFLVLSRPDSEVTVSFTGLTSLRKPGDELAAQVEQAREGRSVTELASEDPDADVPTATIAYSTTEYGPGVTLIEVHRVAAPGALLVVTIEGPIEEVVTAAAEARETIALEGEPFVAGVLPGSVLDGSINADGPPPVDQYESEEFGFQLAWGAPWRQRSGSTSTGYDNRVLTYEDSDDALVTVTATATENGAEDELEALLENILENTAGAELVASDPDANVPTAEIAFNGQGGPGRATIEVHVLEEGESLLTVIVEALETRFEDVSASARDAVTLDGERFIVAAVGPEALPVASPVGSPEAD